MNNIDIIRKALTNESLSHCNEEINEINMPDMNKILSMLDYGDCDVKVTINNNVYYVEIVHIDNEVDIYLIPESEYVNLYFSGNWENYKEDKC